MSLNEISFPDAKNTCTKKTNKNQKAKNAQVSKSAQSATQRGANPRPND
jgi:hypothetical protein